MAKNLNKKIFEEHIITQEGEVVSSKEVYKTTDPPYVKLYIDCVLTVKGLGKGLNPIFVAFLPHMTYADINGNYGGQIIFVNAALKDMIAKQVGVSRKRIEQAITDFVKANIFKRVAVGTYQVNPNIVGRGDWKDIKNIRATFDFGERDIVADIVKAEESSMSEHQEQLQAEYERQMTFNEGVTDNDDTKGDCTASSAS